MAKANISNAAILTAIKTESAESRRGVMPSMIGVLVNASSKEERGKVASQLRTLKEMGLIHSVEEGRVLCTQQGELAARDLVEAPADPPPSNDVAKQETAAHAVSAAPTTQQDPEIFTLNSLQQGVINTLGSTGALNYDTRVDREHVLKRMRHRGHVTADGRALGPCMARLERLGLIQKHMDHTWSLTEEGRAHYSSTPDAESGSAPGSANSDEGGTYLPPVATADDIAMAMRYPDEPERLCEGANRHDDPEPEPDRPSIGLLLGTPLARVSVRRLRSRLPGHRCWRISPIPRCAGAVPALGSHPVTCSGGYPMTRGNLMWAAAACGLTAALFGQVVALHWLVNGGGL